MGAHVHADVTCQLSGVDNTKSFWRQAPYVSRLHRSFQWVSTPYPWRIDSFRSPMIHLTNR